MNDRIDGMMDARSAGADPGARGGRVEARRHPVVAYFRANPQVFVLLVICVVLGLGTFLAVVFGLLTAGSQQTTGEPSGTVLSAHWLAFSVQSLLP